MDDEKLRVILNEFLNRWKLNNIYKIELNEYVGIGNRDTFCQWVETRTRELGSMKGLPGSIKFGIYERNDKRKRPKTYKNDDMYSWLKAYKSNTRLDAFKKVKEDILSTIKYSISGDFKAIDDLVLPEIFKWKVAFLYSNERLIPIYKREVLFNIADNFGMKIKSKTKISEIQTLMMKNKPPDLSVYGYMKQLYEKFGGKKEKVITSRKGKREAAQNRNTKSQIRSQKGSYIAEQKHNKLQEKLKSILIDKYGENNVLLEENFVDVKLLQQNHIIFYEVKSNSYASDCIRDALGQILFYSFYDTDPRTKKLIIVGQFPICEKEKEFLNYLQDKYKIDIDYQDIKIE